MNAPPLATFDIATAEPLDDRRSSQLTPKMAAYAWRGRCLAEFARSEIAVTRALFVLAPAEKRFTDCALVGARFDTLEQILKSSGGDVASAYCAVVSYRPWHQFRAYLCHGEATISGNSADTWHATYRLLGFSGVRLKFDVMLLSASQAETERRALQRDTNRLVSLLKPFNVTATAFDRLTMSGTISR